MALSQSALSDLLAALRAGGDLDVIREGLALVLQALIEAEAAQQIGADRYERSASRTTHRNGSRSRLLSTKAGDVELPIPKLREGSFFPALLEPRRRIDRALLAVVMEASVPGTSTRKVDDLVRALGVDAGISKSEVSRICGELDAQVAAFRSRPLAHTAFPYVFVDATDLQGRVNGRVVSRAVVIATGVTADGGREVLGLEVGDSEDGAFWTAFLRSRKARGGAGVQPVISDAHTGLKAASPRSWPVPAGSAAESTSCTTCSPGCHEARPRWSQRPSPPSSPSPPAKKSWTRSTRSRPCSPESSRPWRRCCWMPPRT
jgi:putative transposase